MINSKTISAIRQHSTDDLRKASREVYVETENELRKALFAASSIAARSSANTTALVKLSIVITRDLFISKTVNIPSVGGIAIRSINGSIIAPYHDGDAFPLFRWLRDTKDASAIVSATLGLSITDVSLIGVEGKGKEFSALLAIDQVSTASDLIFNLRIEGCSTQIWHAATPQYLIDAPFAPGAPDFGPRLAHSTVVNNLSGWGIRGNFQWSVIAGNVIGPLDFPFLLGTSVSNNVSSFLGTMSISTSSDGGRNVITGNANTVAPVGFVSPSTVVANNVL